MFEKTALPARLDPNNPLNKQQPQPQTPQPQTPQTQTQTPSPNASQQPTQPAQPNPSVQQPPAGPTPTIGQKIVQGVQTADQTLGKIMDSNFVRAFQGKDPKVIDSFSKTLETLLKDNTPEGKKALEYLSGLYSKQNQPQQQNQFETRQPQ